MIFANFNFLTNLGGIRLKGLLFPIVRVDKIRTQDFFQVCRCKLTGNIWSLVLFD